MVEIERKANSIIDERISRERISPAYPVTDGRKG